MRVYVLAPRCEPRRLSGPADLYRYAFPGTTVYVCGPAQDGRNSDAAAWAIPLGQVAVRGASIVRKDWTNDA